MFPLQRELLVEAKMRWVRADSSDFGGTLPHPRSGHTAVNVGKSMVIVFGGLVDKRFLSDIAVFDTENKLWFIPECTGTGHDGQVGPSPRAFHVAAAIDCNMFVFGGRFGSKRLGDFWMLDTDIWQWSELTSYGDLPSPRDFAAASAIGNRKIVMYGGWDGKKWLSDVYVLDTISLEWMELSISGTLPPQRCGHTATMVEKRMLVFGGRGGGGPIMGDLWALKGLIEEVHQISGPTDFWDWESEKHCAAWRLRSCMLACLLACCAENETPGWTQLKLPGTPPSPRCGHTVTSGGHYLLLFGGHGTGGWLSRYDVYHNDCIVLDRVSVQWKRLPTSDEPPPARAYHSMNTIGSRYLLFGGFDGKSTFGDLWWLVPEDDPIAKRLPLSPRTSTFENKDVSMLSDSAQYAVRERQKEESPIQELQKKMGISVSPPVSELNVVDESMDKEFLELSSRLARNSVSADDQVAHVQELREHWKNSTSKSIQLRELGPLLRDYQRLIIHRNFENSDFLSLPYEFNPSAQQTYHFYHIKSASQLRMDDIPKLLSEYKQLLSS